MGGPTGFAPVPRHSQCRMQLIHHGPHFRKLAVQPVTLRLSLFDRQVGYFYINGPLKKQGMPTCIYAPPLNQNPEEDSALGMA